MESLLREIPGVAEALLVGFGKPFCAALLWIAGKALDADAAQKLDQDIRQVNHDLSGPEQVKR